jgi:hypothetical protein
MAVHITEKHAKKSSTAREAAQNQAATDLHGGQHAPSYHLDAIRTIAMQDDLLHPGVAPLMRTGAPVAGAPWPEAVDA